MCASFCFRFAFPIRGVFLQPKPLLGFPWVLGLFLAFVLIPGLARCISHTINFLSGQVCIQHHYSLSGQVYSPHFLRAPALSTVGLVRTEGLPLWEAGKNFQLEGTAFVVGSPSLSSDLLAKTSDRGPKTHRPMGFARARSEPV